MMATPRVPWQSLAFLALLSGCGGGEEDPAPAPTPTSRDEVEATVERVIQSGTAGDTRFSDVAQIFTSKCILCHYPSNASGLDLTHPLDPATGLVNRPTRWPATQAKLLVDPANPLNSFLLDKLIRKNLVPELDGNAMPWLIPSLSPDRIGAIRQWISDGALDDDRFRSTVAPIFGDGVSLGASGGNCAYCHNPNSLFEPDLTHPFDPDVGIVNVPDVGGHLRVAPGAPDESGLVLRIEGNPAGGASMPFHPEPLTAEEIDQVTSWVVAGAPDN